MFWNKMVELERFSLGTFLLGAKRKVRLTRGKLLAMSDVLDQLGAVDCLFFSRILSNKKNNRCGYYSDQHTYRQYRGLEYVS